MNDLTMPAVTGGSAVRAESAVARLYVEYRERIYRFCYGRLRSREEAEDALQNVFMRVHMALDRGVIPEYEAAWLYKIAHNVCLSRIDSNSRRGAEELHAFDEDDVQIAAPEVRGDELAGLSEALEGMPHNLRTAILLREWQGLSYAEVAEAMGLSVSAVETLIFRARRHLAWALEHPGEKQKTPARRLLDLLGLGWLRNLFIGAGPIAKLAVGAALLAVTGGGAAVEMTDAHARPVPAAPVAHVPASAPAAQVVRHAAAKKALLVVASPRKAAKVPGTVSARHQVDTPAAVQPVSTPAAASPTPPQVAAPSPSTPAAPAAASPKPPAPTTTAIAATQSAAPSVPTASVPTVSTPSTPDVPTVTVPSVSVPTVSVPTPSVPAVSVPSVGGIAGK
jgi:RNA polymerase sigma factor (sigma-70 family)